MTWLSTLLEWLRQFWPFIKVHPWERGYRTTYWPQIRVPTILWHEVDASEPMVLSPRVVWLEYKPARVTNAILAPGMHRQLLFVDEVRKESVGITHVMDLQAQTVTLKDKTVVSFSTNVEYEVIDIEANILNVHSFEHALEASARIHLARRVREMETLAEFIENQKWLEGSLKETLTTRAKRWGARIVDVGFTDLMPSRALRILGDGQGEMLFK